MLKEVMVTWIPMEFIDKFNKFLAIVPSILRVVLIYLKVEYTAGPKIGFVAKIKSNEPSLKNKANPADVIYNVEETPRPSYMKQQSNNNNQYDMNQMIDNQLGEQIMSMFNNNQRYVTNSENSYGMMKPILAMISRF